jgi:hypothetical protein
VTSRFPPGTATGSRPACERFLLGAAVRRYRTAAQGRRQPDPADRHRHGRSSLLRRRKVTGIVLAGISTSIGVESTARAANERGYELTVVTDAITDTNKGAHLNSLRAIFPQITELATTEEVLIAVRVSVASNIC